MKLLQSLAIMNTKLEIKGVLRIDLLEVLF